MSEYKSELLKKAAIGAFSDVIAVDLDGTLAMNPETFDVNVIGSPVPAMVAKVKKLIADGETVVVFTARLADKKNYEKTQRLIRAWTLKHLGMSLDSTNEKLPGMKLFIDDKARGVEEDTGEFKTATEGTGEFKTAGGPVGEPLPDGSVDYFEPVENPHSVQQLRASVGTGQPKVLNCPHTMPNLTPPNRTMPHPTQPCHTVPHSTEYTPAVFNVKLTKKTSSYTAYVLTEASRAKLLEIFPPQFARVICHHITVNPGVKKDSPVPDPASIRVVGYASDESLECLICTVNDTTKRADGKVFHVTLSLGEGRKPVDSNKVIANGWTPVAPFEIETMPQKVAGTKSAPSAKYEKYIYHEGYGVFSTRDMGLAHGELAHHKIPRIKYDDIFRGFADIYPDDNTVNLHPHEDSSPDIKFVPDKVAKYYQKRFKGYEIKGSYPPSNKLAAESEDDSGHWAGENDSASGILPVCPSTKRVCLAWRSKDVHEGDCWGGTGGAVKSGMKPAASARQELIEETGCQEAIKLIPAYEFRDGDFTYFNYIGIVEEEFELNAKKKHEWENDFQKWFTLDELKTEMEENPKDFHPGFLEFLTKDFDKIKESLELKNTEAPNRDHFSSGIKTSGFIPDDWTQAMITTDWAERNRCPIVEGRVRLYHGTPADTGAVIQQEGLHNRAYLAQEPKDAYEFSRRSHKGRIVVFECWVPLDAFVGTTFAQLTRALTPEELSLKLVKGKTAAIKPNRRTFYHGTSHNFSELKPNRYGIIWLAERKPAEYYAEADSNFCPAEEAGKARLIQVKLKPSAQIVDLRDATDPIVREFMLKIYAPESEPEWENKATHNLLEGGYKWAVPFFIERGVDGVVVNDNTLHGQPNGGKDDHDALAILNPDVMSYYKPKTSSTSMPDFNSFLTKSGGIKKWAKPGFWSYHKWDTWKTFNFSSEQKAEWYRSPESERQVAYLEDCLSLLHTKFDERLAFWKTQTFPLQVYRVIVASDETQIKSEKAGVYWSYDESLAFPAWGWKKKGTWFKLRGSIQNSSQINWQSTLEMNIFNPDEHEVQVNPGEVINVDGISDNHQKEWRQPAFTSVTASSKTADLDDAYYSHEDDQQAWAEAIIAPKEKKGSEGKTAAAPRIYYHGAYQKSLKSILAQGLIPNAKDKNWGEDKDTSMNQPSRISYGGTYVTTNVSTAINAPRNYYHQDGRMVLVIMELQPNTLLADEDSISIYSLDKPLGFASDVNYHILCNWIALTQPSVPMVYKEGLEDARTKYILQYVKQMEYTMEQRGAPMHPRLKLRLNGLVSKCFEASLARRAAHAANSQAKSGYIGYDYKKAYYDVMSYSGEKVDYDKIPPIETIVPTIAEGEAQFREACEKVTRALAITTRPTKKDDRGMGVFDSARVETTISYNGSNHIIAVLEVRSGNQYQIKYKNPKSWNPDNEDSIVPIVVHYMSEPIPEDFLKKWKESQGYAIQWLLPDGSNMPNPPTEPIKPTVTPLAVEVKTSSVTKTAITLDETISKADGFHALQDEWITMERLVPVESLGAFGKYTLDIAMENPDIYIGVKDGDKYVAFIEFVWFKNRTLVRVSRVGVMQAYQGAGLMPKLYAHLLKSKVFDSIQSDYLQSFGGKAVWQQLAKEPGIHVFGWHKSTKEPFYIEQKDIDEDEVWDTELQDLLEESKKIREELLTEQDEKRREYLLERKEEISESIGGDHGTAQHQDHYEDVTLVAQRSGGKLANRLLNKKASPDFGYSKFNDREADINKLEWRTNTRDTARGRQVIISANEYSKDWHNPVIKEPSPEGKFSCVAEIRLISHPSYLAVGTADVFARRWVGTGVGQMLYDKAIEYAKKKGFRFFCSDNKEHSMSPESINAWTTRLSARYNVTFDKEMGRYMIDLQHSSKTASPATTLPQLFYRGTNPEDTRRIRTGNDFWDSLLFVTDDPKKARNYGSQVDTYQFKPEAKVLREHTREFNRLGRWKKGESLLDYCSRLTLAAKEAGYDAVYFTMQGDVGTAVINRDSIEKLSEIKTLSDNVFTDTPDMFEAGAGLKFQVVEVRICDIQDTGWPTNCYKRYAKLMKAGEKFPLILVKKTRNGELTLEDGVHRLAAFKLAFPNEECIPVALFEDSKKERGGDKTAAAVPATTPAFEAWFSGSKVVDAQGNPLRCYHGTRVGEDFDEFSVDGPPVDDYGEPSSSGSGGDPSAYLGAHFSVEPEVASSFALSTVNWMKTRYDGEDQRPRVIPVYLNIKNPKNFGDELNLHSFIYEGKLNGYASEDSLKDAMYANGIQDEDSQEAQDWWNKYDTDVVFRKEQNEWALVNANDESAQEIAQELGSDARSRLEQQGFDGIKYKNRMEGGNAYVVFNPSQVKSAIGNAGTYDPQQNSITAKLKSKLLQPKTAVVPLTHTMYHVSRRRNRASIQKLGLEPRIQEFDDIERKPGIYMLETLAQAQDWAYWFGSGELQIVDIWEITLPKGYRVEPETSKDFTDIYDAWIGYEAIPPANLKLVESMQPDKKGTNPPLTGRTLKVKR